MKRVYYFFMVTLPVVNSLKIGTILLEKQHDYISSGIALMVRSINDHILNDLSFCSIEQSSVLTVGKVDADLIRDKVNKLHAAGIDIIIGPPEENMSEIIERICSEIQLPFIKYVWQWDKCSNQEPGLSSVYNVFPSGQFIHMLNNILRVWNWDSYVIAVSKTTASCRLHDIISTVKGAPSILEIDDSSKEGLMEATNTLRDICDRKSCWNMVNRVLIDMQPDKTLDFLDMSLKLGMINSINWFLVTNLDNLFDHMEPYSHNKMRISLVSTLNLLTDRTLETRNDEIKLAFEDLYSEWLHHYPRYLQTPNRDFALLFDAISLSCHLKGNVSNSNDLITTPEFHGITGPLFFNISGERLDSLINVWELGINGRAINMRILKVTTIEERPYVMEKLLPSGEIVYEGFCVDLLEKLAEHLNFDYELNIVKDGRYGEPLLNDSTQWDGMIGELIRGEADMAVAPITVTAERLEAVDFTDPFLQLGISMLMREPDKTGSAVLMSFLLPLSPAIWIFTLCATIATSFLVTLVCVVSPKEKSKEFTLASGLQNSVWYLACILLRAGSGYNCQSTAARVASTVWWVFTLVLIAQYTANFAAVLTVERRTMPFNSFEEMGNQTEYAFGSILGGSTMQFFKYSRIETFQRIWQRMQNMTPSVFVATNYEGVQRVLSQNYVFLMESASLEYQVTQNCNLTRVGNVVLGSNGYSIALPKDSRWRERLTRQILDFNEKGVMMMLKNNWWKKAEGASSCVNEAVQTGQALGMDHIAGLFVLLSVGLTIGFSISFVEKAFFAIQLKTFGEGSTPRLK